MDVLIAFLLVILILSTLFPGLVRITIIAIVVWIIYSHVAHAESYPLALPIAGALFGGVPLFLIVAAILLRGKFPR